VQGRPSCYWKHKHSDAIREVDSPVYRERGGTVPGADGGLRRSGLPPHEDWGKPQHSKTSPPAGLTAEKEECEHEKTRKVGELACSCAGPLLFEPVIVQHQQAQGEYKRPRGEVGPVSR
jgi:hypothetical protein